ncbi:MAG: UbiD family decarboxylase [Rhodospirillaceae bacterium]|nr:UbiD family decarboxylase [Rhodospirillaceae bacterium]MDE0361937.1 UbiD family decarboxylase [Rhodospirillaceae bacterium]
MSQGSAGYPDFQDHLARLDARGLLRRIDRPIDKNTELHPLVRWQYQGGLGESERSAFLFTRVTGTGGQAYSMPVAVGALAATPEIYAVGMGVAVEEIGARWLHAMKNPVPPVSVDSPPCQQIVIRGDALTGPGGGLDALPVPISTPGYDAAPYLVATLAVTRDPDTGVRNMGTYRAALKAPDRLGVRMATRVGGAGGYLHWQKYRALGEPMPCAIAVGAPPAVAYSGPQKLPVGQDEMAVAGGIVGAPIRVAKAVTVDLEVPADAEIVVEGLIDSEMLEPEGPFGESHGHVALEDFNMSMKVTAITRKRSPVLASIVSQVTPSESSVLKKVAYEPMFLAHLRDEMKVRGVVSVNMHEPLTNLRPVIFVRFTSGTARDEVWRGLEAASTLQAQCGKIVIAVSEDIDPANSDAIFWSLAYRMNPVNDIRIVPGRSRGHGPKGATAETESGILVDATRKGPMTPLALPAREYMENARAIWEELKLPALSPQSPWHGYAMGEWTDAWEAFARNAVAGRWSENGVATWLRRRSGIEPETPVSKVR